MAKEQMAVKKASARYQVFAAEAQAILPGYRQTEVGVIPEDWGVSSVQEVGHIRTGPFGTDLTATDATLLAASQQLIDAARQRGAITVNAEFP